MARANLFIDESLAFAFQSALDSSSDVRYITVKIEGETLSICKSVSMVGTIEEDFNSIVPTALDENVASIVLFCCSDVSPRQWIFITWIPDTSKVRDKMLYSSSVEDLKRKLGLGCFVQDYAATVVGDLTWDAYLAATSVQSGSVLTEAEKRIKEEEVLSRNESNISKSTAMGVLAFGFESNALSSLTDFGSNQLQWVELTVHQETFHRSHVEMEGSLRSFSDLLSHEPRFCLYRHPSVLEQASVFFIFYCPEEAPVRMKMTMSSCKVNLTSKLAELNIVVSKTLEVRDRGDLEYMVEQHMLSLQPTSSNGTGTPGTPGVGESMDVSVSHAKPTRPGRGKAKVNKFVSDLVE